MTKTINLIIFSISVTIHSEIRRSPDPSHGYAARNDSTQPRTPCRALEHHLDCINIVHHKIPLYFLGFGFGLQRKRVRLCMCARTFVRVRVRVRARLCMCVSFPVGLYTTDFYTPYFIFFISHLVVNLYILLPLTPF